MSITFNLEVTVLLWLEQLEYRHEKDRNYPLSDSVADICCANGGSCLGWTTGRLELNFQPSASAASIFGNFG